MRYQLHTRRVQTIDIRHPYVTRMCSYVIRMSLVCTRISSVCYLYILVCHPYVTHVVLSRTILDSNLPKNRLNDSIENYSIA